MNISDKERILQNILSSNCGTPLLLRLSKAITAYKNGESVSDLVEIKEVLIEFSPEWKVVAHALPLEGLSHDVYYPTTAVDGVETPTFMDIIDYTPIEGHKITIKALKFTISGRSQYLYQEVISDKYVNDPVIPDYLKDN